MIVTHVLRAVLIGLIPCSVSVEAFTVGRLYIPVFLHAVASAVFGPALTASVPFLVAHPQFTAANALLQSTTSLGIVVGPALSGIGIAALSSQEVLCVNAATYLISAACLLPIRLFREQLTETRGNPVVSTIRDLVEGFRFAFIEQRTIPLLIVMAALYTFGVSAFATLFPVFGRKMLDLCPVEVGYLWSALGLGLFLMSIGLVRLTQWESSRRVCPASVVGGLCVSSSAGLPRAQDSCPRRDNLFFGSSVAGVSKRGLDQEPQDRRIIRGSAAAAPYQRCRDRPRPGRRTGRDPCQKMMA